MAFLLSTKCGFYPQRSVGFFIEFMAKPIDKTFF